MYILKYDLIIILVYIYSLLYIIYTIITILVNIMTTMNHSFNILLIFIEVYDINILLYYKILIIYINELKNKCKIVL